MKNVLFVDCCIRREASNTKKLAEAFLSALPSGCAVTRLDLMAEELSYFKDSYFDQREALLAEREAQLEKEQAEFAAAKERGEEGKKSFLNNNDPNFVNPKEKLYDKFPLTVHQMDIIIGVLFALILLFLVLGMTHTSFFGLFGG